MLFILGRRVQVENGGAETAAQTSGRLGVVRFDVISKDGDVVTVFTAMRAKRYAGVPRSFTYTKNVNLSKINRALCGIFHHLGTGTGTVWASGLVSMAEYDPARGPVAGDWVRSGHRLLSNSVVSCRP